MKGKPSIDDFLGGSTADVAEKSKKKTVKQIEPAMPAKVYREQKIFRLPTDIVEALRDKAYELSKQEGKRVTLDIVEPQ